MKISRSPHHLRPGRRRCRALVAVALAAAVSTTAVGSATALGDAQPTNQAGPLSVACPGLPRGLALTGNGPHRVWRITRSSSTSLAVVRSGVITKAVWGRDGTIWVETRRTGRPNGLWRAIRRIDGNGSRRTSETGNVRLSHVGTVGRRGGITVATYIDRDGRADPEDGIGHVWVESSTGARRSVGWARGWCGHVRRCRRPRVGGRRRPRLHLPAPAGRQSPRSLRSQ
jgi:hypothetical protein